MLKIDYSRINHFFTSNLSLLLLYSEDMNESVDKTIKILNEETLCIE